MFDDEYIKALNAAYWEEEMDMQLGIHPSQVKERIETWLYEHNICGEISYLDWINRDCTVKVYLDESYFGKYNYMENEFVEFVNSN